MVHPAGEVVFTFPPDGGNVRLCPPDDALTPFGGLGPWAAFQKRSGGREVLAATCPGARTSPNAAPGDDELTRFALTVLCAGRRFAQVQRLREDPLNELFGLRGALGVVDLQPVASVSALAGTGSPRGECGRAAVVSADRGAAGPKRTAENLAGECQREVVGAMADWLPAGVRAVGGNCAAVE